MCCKAKGNGMVFSQHHYHWVKENAIHISGYWKSLPVKLQVTDSNTHGTQCERRKSNREQQKDRVCVYVLPKDSNTYLSLKVASVKTPLCSLKNGELAG